MQFDFTALAVLRKTIVKRLDRGKVLIGPVAACCKFGEADSIGLQNQMLGNLLRCIKIF